MTAVEEVFCSGTRIRILKILLKLGQLNVSKLAEKLGSNYKETMKHLRILENEGIVLQRKYGRIHLYRFSDQSAKARANRNRGPKARAANYKN